MTRRTLYTFIATTSLVFLLSASALAQADSKITVIGYIMDRECHTVHSTLQDAKTHPNACALMDSCKMTGYVVVSKDSVYRLDDQGAKLAIAALQAAKTRKGLRVTIVGSVDGEILHVEKLQATPLDS
ncbi:MAG: hypothetical protein ACJ73D_07710 [Pyrinomonadaceae bacterium]